MAASNLDKYKKVVRKWSGTIGGGGVTDASTATIPLTSAINLPTDTAVVVTIDRVDANGLKTPAKEETVIGVASIGSDNLTTCTRGVEGTAQAHSAGAVVEILITAKGWNDFCDAMIAEHSQSGVHDPADIVKIAGTQTVTGNKTFTGTNSFTTGVSTFATDKIKVTNLTVGTYTVTPPSATDTLVGKATTDTLTNKRITKRVLSATNYTTDTGTSLNSDNYDMFIVTAQAGNLLFNNPGGTPTDGQTLWLAVTGTGARALTYGNQYESSAGATLPTTTATTARIDIALVWRADTSKWHCVGAA